jgi:hypothetical protein
MMSFSERRVGREAKSSKLTLSLGDVQEIRLRTFSLLDIRLKKVPTYSGETWQPLNRTASLLLAIMPSKYSRVTLVFPDGVAVSFAHSREDTRWFQLSTLRYCSSGLEVTLMRGPIRLEPISNWTTSEQ